MKRLYIKSFDAFVLENLGTLTGNASTPLNTTGMGNADPGSGDIWGEEGEDYDPDKKRKRKKKLNKLRNEEL